VTLFTDVLQRGHSTAVGVVEIIYAITRVKQQPQKQWDVHQRRQVVELSLMVSGSNAAMNGR
jgi:hypothetical protein